MLALADRVACSLTFCKKMKNAAIGAMRIGAGIGAMALVLIASPFSIPAILLTLLCRGDYPRYVGSAIALIAVLVMRFATGQWIVSIGGACSGPWYIELALGIVSWSLGAILVACSFRLATVAVNQSNRGAAVVTP